MSSYYEESASIAEETALRIMQDDSSLALPAIKPLVLTEPGSSGYFLVLRDLQTNREYMHPEAVASLDNWHCFFVDCPLMQGLDFVSPLTSHSAFPLNLSPPSTDSAVMVRTFNMRDRSFKLTVTRAPPSDEGSPIVCYVLTTSVLPVNYAVFERACGTSVQRKACMARFAVLPLLESKGLQIETVSKGMPEDADALLLHQLSLEHGPQIFHGMSTKGYQGSGWFSMHEREATAGSSSLPLLLKHLSFLQYTLKGPVHYCIKAPNKYAYMVWLRDVGGLEIYFQVNMHASLPAMQNAFAGSSAPPGGGKIYTSSMQRGNSSLLQKNHLLETIREQMDQLRGVIPSLELDTLNENDFVAHMKYTGLDIMRRAMESESITQQRAADNKVARRVLESFSAGSGATERPSLGEVLKTACLVLMGIVIDAWDNLSTVEEKDRPAALIALLAKELGDTHYCRFKDIALLPVLVSSCMDCSPYKWWERFATLCEIQGPKKASIQENEKSAYLCASILYHQGKYSRLFQLDLGTGEEWSKRVEDACGSDTELAAMKESYEGLLKSRLDDVNEGVRRLHYVRAVAFIMLVGEGSEKLQRLKT